MTQRTLRRKSVADRGFRSIGLVENGGTELDVDGKCTLPAFSPTADTDTERPDILGGIGGRDS